MKVWKEFCSVAEDNFAQSFMGKKSKLQIENKFSIHFSAREKVLENQLSVESNLKNYPVDDFWPGWAWTLYRALVLYEFVVSARGARSR